MLDRGMGERKIIKRTSMEILPVYHFFFQYCVPEVGKELWTDFMDTTITMTET